jgi:hypothetical protein
MTDRILNGPDTSQVLADENASWLLPDNLGTTCDVAQYNSGTNTTTVVDHLKYDAFGKITSQSNSAFQPLFAYTGMRTQINLVSGWESWLWCGAIILVATIGKFGGTGARTTRPPHTSPIA